MSGESYENDQESVMVWLVGATLIAFIVVQALQGAWLLAGVLTVGMIWVVAIA